MGNRVLTAMSALALMIVPAAGQTTAAAAKAKTAAGVKGTWTPPRTPDGHPDLQGVWAEQQRNAARAAKGIVRACVADGTGSGGAQEESE